MRRPRGHWMARSRGARAPDSWPRGSGCHGRRERGVRGTDGDGRSARVLATSSSSSSSCAAAPAVQRAGLGFVRPTRRGWQLEDAAVPGWHLRTWALKVPSLEGEGARSKERAGGSRACGREGHQRRLCASERCVGGSVAQTAEGVSMVGGGGGAFDGMVWTEFLCAWGASAERDGNSQASKEAVRPFACPPHGPLLDPSDPIPHASDLDHVKGLDHTHPHARTHTHTQTQALAAELLKTQTRERSFPSPQSSS